MPQWVHDRAKHLLAKNPDMDKSKAFAIATQQSHAMGKSPKGYGTAKGRKQAKNKYDTPKDDTKSPNPGDLKTPKLKEASYRGFLDELMKISAISWKPQAGQAKAMRKKVTELLSKKSSAQGSDSSYRHNLGKSFTKSHKVMPKAKFVVKQGMLVADTPEKKLQKAQTVGTPDDPNNKFKPLNAFKPPKMDSESSKSTESTFKVGLPKLGYATSQFSGPLGGGQFFHPPMMPALKLPNIYGKDPQLKEGGSKEVSKKAAMAITPKGKLSQSQGVGQPKKSGFSGPSIADVSKPIGFGNKLPGATKNRI